jgi:hypothetical protein
VKIRINRHPFLPFAIGMDWLRFPAANKRIGPPNFVLLLYNNGNNNNTQKRKQTNRSSTITNTHTQTHTTSALSLFQSVFMVYKSLGFTFLLYVRSTGPDDGPTDRPTAGATPVKKKVVHILPP